MEKCLLHHFHPLYPFIDRVVWGSRYKSPWLHERLAARPTSLTRFPRPTIRLISSKSPPASVCSRVFSPRKDAKSMEKNDKTPKDRKDPPMERGPEPVCMYFPQGCGRVPQNDARPLRVQWSLGMNVNDPNLTHYSQGSITVQTVVVWAFWTINCISVRCNWQYVVFGCFWYLQ